LSNTFTTWLSLYIRGGYRRNRFRFGLGRCEGHKSGKNRDEKQAHGPPRKRESDQLDLLAKFKFRNLLYPLARSFVIFSAICVDACLACKFYLLKNIWYFYCFHQNMKNWANCLYYTLKSISFKYPLEKQLCKIFILSWD